MIAESDNRNQEPSKAAYSSSMQSKKMQIDLRTLLEDWQNYGKVLLAGKIKNKRSERRLSSGIKYMPEKKEKLSTVTARKGKNKIIFKML